MENNKEELELLRKYFVNDNKFGCVSKNQKLKQRILEIQNKNKLKYRIENFKELLDFSEQQELDEILKELGYEQ